MNKLSIYLKEANITQAEFAEKVGMTQSAVSQLCSGKMGISGHKAFLIERATRGAVPASEWFIDRKRAS